MKKSYFTLLTCVFIATGVLLVSSGGAFAQQGFASQTGNVGVGMGSENSNRLPYEIDVSDQFAGREITQGSDCQSCSETVITDESLYPEVKNANLFGVDRRDCCDEWAGLCGCKSLDFKCNCGGLKANKGHLGIFWLKSKYGAEDCDFCKGGCCNDGNCDRGNCNGGNCDGGNCGNGNCGNGGGCSSKICGLKSCLKKCGLKSYGQKKCDCNEGPSRISIFNRSVSRSCGKAGCCETGCESCPEEQGCQSCR